MFLWQTLGLQSQPDRHVFKTFLGTICSELQSGIPRIGVPLPLMLSSHLLWEQRFSLVSRFWWVLSLIVILSCSVPKTRLRSGAKRSVLEWCFSNGLFFNSIYQDRRNGIEHSGVHCTWLWQVSYVPWNFQFSVCACMYVVGRSMSVLGRRVDIVFITDLTNLTTVLRNESMRVGCLGDPGYGMQGSGDFLNLLSLCFGLGW